MCGDIIKCFTIVVITILLDDVSIILKGDGMYTQYIAIVLLFNYQHAFAVSK